MSSVRPQDSVSIVWKLSKIKQDSPSIFLVLLSFLYLSNAQNWRLISNIYHTFPLTISEKPGNPRLLSGRRTLEEPTIPRSIRTTSRQTARSEISALSKPRYGAQSARSRSQAPRSTKTSPASIVSKAQSYQAQHRSQSPNRRPTTSASTSFSRTSQLETIKEQLRAREKLSQNMKLKVTIQTCVPEMWARNLNT